jgi:hypothetical protein
VHLHSTGGLGLNDADVSKVTKVVLYAPPNIDTLSKQLAVFATLCGAVFREKSVLQVEMDDWIMHITKFKATYQNMQNSRPPFCPTTTCLFH